MSCTLYLILMSLLGQAKPANVNVIILTIDTLRADRLGCYGHDRETSPNMDALARESVLLEQLFSQSSFTPPSHASIFTSLYVRQHGLLTWNSLADRHETLAEVLSEAGFKTAAIAHLRLLSQHNLGQGFQTRDEESGSARAVTQRALEWIDANRPHNTFLWLHYFDVHSPYGNHPEFERMFNASHDPVLGRDMKYYNLHEETRLELKLTKDDVAFMKDRYDAGIAYCDLALGELVDGLKKLHVWDNTLLVVTSDHGESLDDHQEVYFAHDPFLFDPVIRIPCIIHLPGGRHAGLRVQGMVQSIDLAPTILGEVGAQSPAQFEGRDLRDLFVGRSQPQDRVFSECWGWQIRKSLRTTKWKLVWTVPGTKKALFDLQADPAEQTDVSKEHPDVLDRLFGQLKEWATAQIGSKEENPKLDQETVDRIRALGYVGGT